FFVVAMNPGDFTPFDLQIAKGFVQCCSDVLHGLVHLHSVAIAITPDEMRVEAPKETDCFPILDIPTVEDSLYPALAKHGQYGFDGTVPAMGVTEDAD